MAPGSRGAATVVPLLERDAELGALAAHAEAAAGGAGRMVLVDGAPGIGKTSLLRAARVATAAAGVRWLTARGTELERDYPFGVVRQLLDPLASEVAEAAARGGPAALAARVLEPAGAAPAAPEPDFAALHGLFWLVAALAEDEPLVLCVDDLQWADAASVRFLSYLAVRVDGLPVLGLLAARSSARPGDDAAGALVHASDVERLPVGPLGRAGARTLVRDALGADAGSELCDACHDATGGNPFLLRALTAELRERHAGAAADPDVVRSLAPPAIVRSVRTRLEATSPAAVALARAVAVLGDPADLAHATSLAELDAGVAAAAADELAETGFLVAGQPLRIVHPLTRSALLEGIALADRAALHRRAARLLLDAPDGLDAAAGQLLAAHPAGEAWAVDVLLRAAAVARGRGAADGAATYLRRALAEPPGRERLGDVLAALARAAAVSGEPDALALAERAVAELPPGPARLAATIEAGHLHNLAGRGPQAAAMVEAALDDGALPDAARAGAESLLLAWAHTSLEVHRQMAPRMAAALTAARGPGPAPPLPVLGPVALELATVSGTAAEAAVQGERALAGGRLVEMVSGDTPLPYMAVLALVIAGRWDAAENGFADLLADAARRGSARGFTVANALRAVVRAWRGDLRGAEADARVALDAAEEHQLIPLLAGLPAAALADVLRETGDLDGAEAALERTPVAGRVPGLLSVPWYVARARVRLAAGRPLDALEDLGVCADWERDWGAANGVWVPWRAFAAEALVAVGRGEEAVARAAEALGSARAFGAGRPLGLALRAAALAGPHDDRAAGLDEAAEALDAGGAAVEALRARVERGEALAAAGDATTARAVLGAALQAAGDAGASVLEERARVALVALGARPRRRRSAGPAALTPAERRVAELAAGGRRNQDIAAALFLTTKTVETHLTSAYRKLGIGSRTQLAEHLG